MREEQIVKVLALAKHNQLEHLRWKTEHLSNEVNALEAEKMKSIKDDMA